MSQENAEVVERAFKGVMDSDRETAVGYLHPEVEGGDQVIALFRMIARGEGSGLEVERLDAIVYRLKGTKIVRLEYFNDQEQALEAAGLSE